MSGVGLRVSGRSEPAPGTAIHFDQLVSLGRPPAAGRVKGQGRPLFLVDEDTRNPGVHNELPEFHPTVLTRGRAVESQEQTLRT